MEFANKEYLFLLLLAIPYIIWYVMYRKKSEPTMRMSDTFAFRYAPKSWKVRLMPLQMILRLIAFSMLVCGRCTGTTADKQLVEEPTVGRYRHNARNGRIDKYARRRPQTKPNRGCEDGGFGVYLRKT